MKSKPKAFVLMPFDPEFDSIYQDLIAPALTSAGYDVARADTLLTQRNILKDIVAGIATAALVVADLTTLNSNVLYELGIAHGLYIPTVLLAQSDFVKDVPFDLLSYRVQPYSTHFKDAPQLKDFLIKIAEKHKTGDVAFGSPVTDFLQTTKEPQAAEGTAIKKHLAREVSEALEEKGFLDFIAEGTDASEAITRIMEGFGRQTEAVGQKIGRRTTQLNSITDGPGAAPQAHRIALATASDMDGFSAKLEAQLPALEQQADTFTTSFWGYASWLSSDTDEHKQSLKEARDMLAEMLKSVRGALEGTQGFRDATNEIRNLRISQQLSRASRRMTTALDRIVAVMESIEAFCVRTVSLLEQKLG